MQIGELARSAGVTAKTIRYYEEIGVLPRAQRADNGYRVYGQSAVDRLSFVRDAQATGLSLDEIAAVLGLKEGGEATCEHVMHLLEQHLSELDARIVALHKTRDSLARITAEARRLDPADCDDPNRCQTIAPGTSSNRDSFLPSTGEIHAPITR